MSEEQTNQDGTQPTGELPTRRSALDRMNDVEAPETAAETAAVDETRPDAPAQGTAPAKPAAAPAKPAATPAKQAATVAAAPVRIDARPTAPAETPASRRAGIRRIKMTVSHVDPLSTLKLGFLVSVAVGIMLVVAMALVWLVLDKMFVFAKITELLTTLDNETLLKLAQYLEFSRWMSFGVIIAIVDVVLMTVLSLVGSLIYNLIAALVGGVKLTLSDE